mmetsp:Transcript_44154/g.112705  ORF Transcript_44154/g.112705 Transcript_44154/m.112705 type:complete len:370 (+) Transcript_44154:1059-2168(+)
MRCELLERILNALDAVLVALDAQKRSLSLLVQRRRVAHSARLVPGGWVAQVAGPLRIEQLGAPVEESLVELSAGGPQDGAGDEALLARVVLEHGDAAKQVRAVGEHLELTDAQEDAICTGAQGHVLRDVVELVDLGAAGLVPAAVQQAHVALERHVSEIAVQAGQVLGGAHHQAVVGRHEAGVLKVIRAAAGDRNGPAPFAGCVTHLGYHGRRVIHEPVGGADEVDAARRREQLTPHQRARDFPGDAPADAAVAADPHDGLVAVVIELLGAAAEVHYVDPGGPQQVGHCDEPPVGQLGEARGVEVRRMLPLAGVELRGRHAQLSGQSSHPRDDRPGHCPATTQAGPAAGNRGGLVAFGVAVCVISPVLR